MELRVWWIRNVPNEPSYYKIDTVEEAVKKINALAEDDLRDPLITSNASGFEVFEDGEWTEYYDELGRDIDEIINNTEI